MNTRKPDSEDVLRRINDYSAEAEHTEEESRDALQAAGVDPDAFVSAVRSRMPQGAPSSSRVEGSRADRRAAGDRGQRRLLRRVISLQLPGRH
jgi:hypothetical protein